MSNEEVEVLGEKKNLKQWAKGLFYRKDNNKETLIPERLSYFLIGLFVIMTLVLLFQGSPVEESVNKAEPIEYNEGNVSQENNVHVPEFKVKKKKKKSAKKRINRSYTPPKVIFRPSSGKIPPATMGRGVLITGASDGTVSAELREDLEVNGEVIFEAGSKLYGRGTSGEDRLFIVFNKIVFENGEYQEVRATAHDVSDKIMGLKGNKVGRTALKWAGSAGLSFLGGVADGLQERKGQEGVEVRDNSLGNAALNGVTAATLSTSREMMEELKNKQNRIEVKAGKKIFIVFDEAQ